MEQNHPIVIKLRKAALAFAEAIRQPVTFPDDKEFRRFDLELQRAARRFAEAEWAEREKTTRPGWRNGSAADL